ncbi:3-oxoacyl-[acyl-carrier-protein] synthase III C-terminal domain-containing protein [Halorubellus sp. PRR65]|uniref:3-oxoacyl-[acyl-carrier-protein] synthase III C-terminal domain-containing protein n=1 Tax=Halorubellus sp. PRR65 TaxID=3098148 RepID=UPI002B25695C|nr:3-oxoacyl-[acyl-carrier-protein] synthase III C-terminal domain-containing protein [Halorubellus sp. PRR65]
MTEVCLTGVGTYVPDGVVTGEEIAAESGIPEHVVTEKMGLREKRVCPSDDDHATDMSAKAAREALDDADVDAEGVDLVLYHGSEFKDHVVWSAAANVAERIGAENAYATESYTLCAGAPIALRQVAAQIRAGDVERALLVSASREEDLVDYENERSSFMFNFGSGASAFVLEAGDATATGGDATAADASRADGGDPTTAMDGSDATAGAPASERARAVVRGSAAVTDGSFSMDVVMPAGGSKHPPSRETVDADEPMHTLDVPDPDGMKERLGDVSLRNYLDVADDALAESGYDRDDLDFVAVTHMKRSFHEYLLSELGVDPATDSYYLDEYGHVQSVDQALAVEEALAADPPRLEPGDTVLFLAAGTGYTWAATVLEWT